MKAPPAGVKLTMEAVCIMKEIPPAKVPAPDGKGKVDDFWDPAKKMMNDSKFLQSLQDYDKVRARSSSSFELIMLCLFFPQPEAPLTSSSSGSRPLPPSSSSPPPPPRSFDLASVRSLYRRASTSPSLP